MDAVTRGLGDGGRSSTSQKGNYKSMRWPLSALLLGMAVVAATFGVFTTFWNPSHPNHTILLGAFVLLVCTSAVAAVFGTAKLRSAFVGATLFGTTYLIVVLHGGFGLETINDSEWLARNTKIGFALLGISFLASKLAQMVTWPSSQRTRIIDEQSHALEPAVGMDPNGKSSPPAQ